MAAAIGVGLPVLDPALCTIIDIGAGTTKTALISLSGIVSSRSVQVAGEDLDEAIMQYMKRAYNLMIGERTAEEIKIKIGSAYPSEKETIMEFGGRDLVRRLADNAHDHFARSARGSTRSAFDHRRLSSTSRLTAARPILARTWSLAASCSRAEARCCAALTSF